MHSHLKHSEWCVESYQRKDFAINNLEFILPAPNVATFRGTDRLRDIISDFRLIFLSQFDKELEPLLERLLEEFDLSDGIELGGHSLGAAIAIRIAVLLIRLGCTVNQLVCFAPPRIGRFPELDDVGRITYHRNGNDLVTYVPSVRHHVKPLQLSRLSLRILSRHRMSEYKHLMRKKYGLTLV